MTHDNTEPADDGDDLRTDGGMTDVEREEQIDYMEVEINLLKPGTPFMRDHLRVIWTGFIIWAFTTFGPVTATVIAPDTMTTAMPVLEFPLHYFLIAIGGPSAALILSVWYARKRDQIDEKYNIEQPTPGEPGTGAEESVDEDVAATDGGVEQ